MEPRRGKLPGLLPYRDQEEILTRHRECPAIVLAAAMACPGPSPLGIADDDCTALLSRLGEGELAYSTGKTLAGARPAGEVCADLKVDRCLSRRKFYVVVRIGGNAMGDQAGRAIGLDHALE